MNSLPATLCFLLLSLTRTLQGQPLPTYQMNKRATFYLPLSLYLTVDFLHSSSVLLAALIADCSDTNERVIS